MAMAIPPSSRGPRVLDPGKSGEGFGEAGKALFAFLEQQLVAAPERGGQEGPPGHVAHRDGAAGGPLLPVPERGDDQVDPGTLPVAAHPPALALEVAPL